MSTSKPAGVPGVGEASEAAARADIGSIFKQKDRVLELASERTSQVTLACAACGALLLGSGCAVAGLLIGTTVGAALGLLPALLTFGLSVPLGGFLGALCGLAAGALLGSGAGFVGAGLLGYGLYTRRKKIGAFLFGVRTRVQAAQAAVFAFCADCIAAMRGHAACACGAGMATAAHAVKTSRSKALELASDKALQASAVSAFSGAVVLGAGGGVLGLTIGMVVGGAVGLIPAVFTFGLSIPALAILGGVVGFPIGTVFGGAVGLVGGGVTGYTIIAKPELTSSSLDCAKCVKEAACTYTDYLLVRIAGGTGSTSD
mmetsp:Transcript_36004/g.90470  ORF Transcript_36004/g.90470 Transcript_36004/m.90470 type:complete len:316 (-) Transcript_36004:293-1240(-)